MGNMEPKFRTDLLVALTTNHKSVLPHFIITGTGLTLGVKKVNVLSQGQEFRMSAIMGLEDYFWNLDVTFQFSGLRLSHIPYHTPLHRESHRTKCGFAHNSNRLHLTAIPGDSRFLLEKHYLCLFQFS